MESEFGEEQRSSNDLLSRKDSDRIQSSALLYGDSNTWVAMVFVLALSIEGGLGDSPRQVHMKQGLRSTSCSTATVDCDMGRSLEEMAEHHDPEGQSAAWAR